MPSRIIAFPIALIALYLGYQIFENYRTDLVIYLLLCLMVLVVIYVFHPQLDWLIFRNRPPKTHAANRALLDRFILFYKPLSPSMKRRFEQRFELYQRANDFIPTGFKKFPADIQAFISAFAVQVNFGREKYLTEPYHRIVAYPHPFPSPQYPKHLHASEIHKEEGEDGVLVISAEQVFQIVSQPFKFYNFLLHELSRIFMELHPTLVWPKLEEKEWEDMKQISGMDRAFIEACIGRPDVELLPVAVTLFFVFPWKFKALRPDLYDKISRNVNLDPCRNDLPIIDPANAGPDY